MATVRYADVEGAAHGRPPAQPNPLLTQVGPPTPCGEDMRPFWRPACKSEGAA